MSDQGNDGISVGGLLSFVAAVTAVGGSVYGILSQRPPLVTSRPPAYVSGSLEPDGRGFINASLWQDPILATSNRSICNAINASNVFENSDVLLGIMVAGGHERDLNERRLRARYAVIQSLLSADYRPKMRDQIGTLGLPVVTDLDRPSALPTQVRLPFEGFVAENLRGCEMRPSNITVIWLDENEMWKGDCELFDSFVSILKDTNVASLRLRHVIGPSESAVLANMVHRANNLEVLSESNRAMKTHLRTNMMSVGPTTLSLCYATAGPAPIRAMRLRATSNLATEVRFPVFHGNDSRIAVERGNVADSDLVKALGDELHRLQLFPGQPAPASVPCLPGRTNHMLVVADGNSFYARAIAREISARLRYPTNGLGQISDASVFFDTTNSCVHRVTYISGVDALAGRNAGGGDIFESSGSSGNALAARPEGSQQMDYLARLAVRVRQENDDLSKTQRGRITTVAVVGADVYDKLLVIRALRKELPHALFVTTDLDAVMWEAGESRYTRNVLALAGYDLKACSQESAAISSQRILPPFRDSYQAAIHASIQRALFGTNDWPLPKPRLFELSDAGPVPLPDASGRSEERWHAWRNFGLIGLLGLIPLVIALSNRLAGRSVVWFPNGRAGGTLVWCSCACAVVGTVCAWSLFHGSLEPFGIGVSSWWALGLRAGALTLGGVFWWLAINDVAKALSQLSGRIRSTPMSKPANDDVSAIEAKKALDEGEDLTEYENAVLLRGTSRECSFAGLAALWISLCLVVMCAWTLGTPLRVPWRDMTARSVDSMVVALTTLVVLGLTAFVGWVIWHAARFVRNIGEKVSDDRTCLREWDAIEIIGSHTSVLGRLISYPFTVLLLLALSYNWVFDDWHWNTGMAVCVYVIVVVLLGLAALLQCACNAARRDAVDSLADKVRASAAEAETSAGSSPAEAVKARIEKHLAERERIAGYREGAFGRWTNSLFSPATISGLGLALVHGLGRFLGMM